VIGRALVLGVAMALAAALSACGEKPQKMDAAARKVDAEPWLKSDTANPAFYASGWKVGDKTAWEDQIRQRNQAQNDYQR
jgi:hypothetical protein